MKKIAIISLASSSMKEAQKSESTSLLTYLSDLYVSYETFHDQFEAIPIRDFDGLCLLGDLDFVETHSNWSAHKSKATLHKTFQKLIMDAHNYSTPIGCINNAALLVALALGSKNVNLAIPDSYEFLQEIKSTGAYPIDCPAEDFISDRDCKVISTPGFMSSNKEARLVHKGIFRFTKELVEMS